MKLKLFVWPTLALSPLLACGNAPTDNRVAEPAPAAPSTPSHLKVGDNVVQPFRAANGSTVSFVLTDDVAPAVTIIEQGDSANPDPAPAPGSTLADIFHAFAPDRPMPAELEPYAGLATKQSTAGGSDGLVCDSALGRNDCDTSHATMHGSSGPPRAPRSSGLKADEICTPLWFQANLGNWNTGGGNYCTGTADYDWQYCLANQGTGAYVYANNIYTDSWAFCDYSSSGQVSISMAMTANGGTENTYLLGSQSWIRGYTVAALNLWGWSRYSWSWGLGCTWCDVQVAGGIGYR